MVEILFCGVYVYFFALCGYTLSTLKEENDYSDLEER